MNMSVGLLIISHDGIGPVMLGTALYMLGGSALKIRLLTASGGSDPDELCAEAREQMKSLDDGDGILVIADLYGSTPSNIAQKLAAHGNVRSITGLNLSMLVRILNYPQLDLAQLTEKALSGGKDGIALLENT
jgi:PTS system ascorbate-specific IIA component